MFEQTILAGTAKTRRAWTVPVCFAGQLAAVGCLALVPLVFFEGLPQGQLAPPRLSVPVGYRAPDRPHAAVKLVAVHDAWAVHTLVQPSFTPKGIHLGPDLTAAPADPGPACIGICVVGSPGPLDSALTAKALPPVPDDRLPDLVRQIAKPTPTPAPIRVNSGVQEALLIHRVMPRYPKLAIPLRVSGDVHLAAVIGVDGRIRELQVLSGHPLLVPAAVDAVREWVYRPTMLSGAPVEVMTDITVTFTLR